METTTPHSPLNEEPFELVIRLQQFRSDSPLDGTMVRAQALVKDVLLSRLRVEAEIDAQENVRAQGSGDLGKVLAASRALQIAFEGFRDASAAGHTSIAMVLGIPPVVDPDISSISPPTLVGDLVTSAKPSQVLITHSFYGRVPHFHSACRLLPMPGGLYEFFWTNEQKLYEMQAEAERMPIHVEEPRQSPERIESVLQQPERDIYEPPVTASAWHDSGGTRAPEASTLDPVVRPNWWADRRILALASGVVVVVLFAWLLYSFVLGGKPTAKTTTTTVVTPPVTTAPPATEAPLPKAPAKPVSTPAQSAVTPKPAKTRHACAIDGPIPAFLKRAEADSSSGRYESAIRRFTEILECEPGNREAALELQKAKDSQKYAP